MLQHALDPKRTLESFQTALNNEALETATTLVARGLARWKPNMDGEKAREVVKEWQDAKNAIRVKEILGNRVDSLF